MFDHEDIEKYALIDVPLNRDIYLMGEEWMAEYDRMLIRGLSGGEWGNPGYISYAAARRATEDGIEISWYPNIFDRFHQVRVYLPKRHFVRCVSCITADEKPRIFVKDDWLNNLYLRTYSVFALVDAVGVKKALAEDRLSADRLASLQGHIDDLASKHTDLAFVSFADSLIVKTNWSVGTFDTDVQYTYEPEKIIHVLPELEKAYLNTLGLPIYAVVSQGYNEFYHHELIHRSVSGNHISLNSLGLPFAQLQSIESAARKAIRAGEHDPAQLYMDDHFFRSLRMKFEFDKDKEPKNPYLAPMSSDPGEYVRSSFSRVIDNLKED
ncbi:hypothetical protein HFP57_02250 [Parasphingopyxis algicola]|uniref:hypothetical protein n=1 Tax=Parasphingopyxis algicola TaxID=2026624 RepID=UPI0015A15742|nr:hypothetical protein [Parasphingopyxis algicola]QLC23968.1 hypothetical protein HFP57_02250 [Parasphingopyxis algicola]